MNELLPKRIKEERLKLNLTQQELAEKLGLTPAAIGMYEQGRREPDLETLFKMADMFSCSLDYLAGKVQKKDEYLIVIEKAKKSEVSVKQLDSLIDIISNKDK